MLSQCGYSDPAATFSSLLKACPNTCDSCDIKVGGDPIFHKGDRWVKFTIGTLWAQRNFANPSQMAHPLNARSCGR